MCGIAGSVGTLGVGASRERVAAMLRLLRHRGPDGEGMLGRERASHVSVVLGHRRLSIIDLSAAAAQPMTSADGTRHIILNGEIYNYRELRSELETLGCRFRSRSDTEVLLEGWCVWGPRVLDRVIGMFAFALLDETRGSLFLARDQFSIKPLYYVRTAESFVFASEIPPLLAVPGVGRRADPRALADFLERGVNNHAGHTMFADVRELPGAHLAELELDASLAMRITRYWSPPTAQVHDLSLGEAASELRERLAMSVGLHLRSDVPLGTMLSGGTDSSTVLIQMRRALGPGAELHAFSYRGEDGAVDEGPFQEIARAAAGAIGHEVRLRPEEWAADAAAVIASQGEPFGSLAIYGQRRLFQLAAEHGVRVVLDGQGSDEYLAGYSGFMSGRLASLLREGRWAECVRLARGYARAGERMTGLLGVAAGYTWPVLRRLRRRFAPQRLMLLDPDWLAAGDASLSPPWGPTGGDVLREMLGRWLSAPSIPWLMRYADRNAMAFSVENRLPFLNVKLVEFVLGLPEEHFIRDDGTGKNLLREAMRGLVPDPILDRRDKTGFDVPIEAWLPRTPGLPELLDEAARIPAVNGAVAASIVGSVRSRQAVSRPDAFRAWRLVTLAAWARQFGVRFD